jgi:hypothetical protein
MVVPRADAAYRGVCATLRERIPRVRRQIATGARAHERAVVTMFTACTAACGAPAVRRGYIRGTGGDAGAQLALEAGRAVGVQE